MTAADVSGPAVELWPCHERALRLFTSLSTQWRHGFAGPTGLDYGPLLALMERMRLTDEEHDGLFEDVRTMERAALDVMRESAKK